MNFSKPEQNTLSIRLGADGFSFSVFCPLSNEPPFIQERDIDPSLSLTANARQAFREIEWLSLPYRRVNILMADQRFTLQPLELFDDEQVEQTFYYNHPRRDNETVLYNILNRNNIVVLFGIEKSLHAFLSGQYPVAKFYAQVTPLIDYFAAKSRLGNCQKVYVQLHKEAIDIFAYERGRLLTANTFPCRATADCVYYLLYIWKQLGMSQERDEMHLTGNLSDKDTLLSELKRFIRQVFITNPTNNLDLQAIIQCE